MNSLIRKKWWRCHKHLYCCNHIWGETGRGALAAIQSRWIWEKIAFTTFCCGCVASEVMHVDVLWEISGQFCSIHVCGIADYVMVYCKIGIVSFFLMKTSGFESPRSLHHRILFIAIHNFRIQEETYRGICRSKFYISLFLIVLLCLLDLSLRTIC